MTTSSSGVLESRGRNREVVDSIFRVGSLNVRTLTGKFLELVDGLKKRHVDVIYVGATKGMLGITLEKIHDKKETWWWNEDVKLFNESRISGEEIEWESVHQSHCYSNIQPMNSEEIGLALKKMGKGKATGPVEIPIEVWWCLGKEGERWLTQLFNLIFRTGKIPHEWKLSIVIPIYKNKGDAQNCNNFRGIKLLRITMKLWERVIEIRLRSKVIVSENQFGFMPGRSATEAIHLLRRLMGKYIERRTDLHMVFIDLEKAMIVFCATTPVSDTQYFPVKIGLHQGSSLSPFLFAIIIDVLTRGIQDIVPWCMLFADDIVIINEKKSEINEKLEQWRVILGTSGLRVSHSKNEYMWCNFSNEPDEEGVDVRIGEHLLVSKESFKYLGSMIYKDGKIDADVTHRIHSGWLKWRAASGTLCDKKIPLELKGRFYRREIRSALLYGAECWALTKAQEQCLDVAEMRMLRWILWPHLVR
ncbi:hypothetical protein AgCh_031314 [Apium graveolens]